MSTRTRTALESAWLTLISSMGCVLCRMQGRGYQPAEIHHIREGQGMSERASDFLAVPLCPDCHRLDKGAVHGDRGLLRISKVDELDLVAETVQQAAEALFKRLRG